MQDQEEFLKKLREAFNLEAAEHLSVIASSILSMEELTAPYPKDLIETAYRAAHSLKGASRAVDLRDIETICHAIEGAFSKISKGELEPHKSLLELLLSANDTMEGILKGTRALSAAQIGALAKSIDEATIPKPQTKVLKLSEIAAQTVHQPSQTPPQAKATEAAEETPPPKQPQQQMTAQPHHELPAAPQPQSQPAQQSQAPQPIQSQQQSSPKPVQPIQPPSEGSARVQPEPTSQPATSVQKSSLASTIRLPTEKLELVLRDAENVIGAKLALRQILDYLRGISSDCEELLSSKENDPQKLLQLIAETSKTLKKVSKYTASEEYRISATIDKLIDDARSMLMLPCSLLLEGFPRMVHDLAHSMSKKIELAIEGKNIELEKHILEKLKDPLTHLVRNSIDHGIESPEERVKAGKPGTALIQIKIANLDSKHIEISVSDDGKGLDYEKIKNTAIARSLITKEEAATMDKEHLSLLIFESGFSTSPMVTDLSGRGLGMSIVQQAVDELDGYIKTESTPGQGTTFRLVVPYSRATFRATLIKVSNRKFALPTSSILKTVRMKTDSIFVAGGREMMYFDSKPIGVLRVDRLLNLPQHDIENTRGLVSVIITQSGDSTAALLVDEILHEQELLLKPLGQLLKNIALVSGASIAGDGEIIPVLSVKELMRSVTARELETSFTKSSASQTKEKKTKKKKSILVVEDSITSRMLLKTILESEGYLVSVAVDGQDGYTVLKSNPVDCVVTDIEMPRMNGFELTAKIRSDKKLGDLPVILVTSLESREDKERGVEVGANAYIQKSNFSQTTLLDTIKRFI